MQLDDTDLVPRGYWQPIFITCTCGREHGGHRIELWEANPGGVTWTGERCGTLDFEGPHDVDRGTGGLGLGPEDKAPLSRLRPRSGRWPTWWGRCKHCGLDVRIRGDQLAVLLCGLAQHGVQRIELRAIGQAAACR